MPSLGITDDPELLRTDPDYFYGRLLEIRCNFDMIKAWLTSKWERVRERSRYLEKLLSEIAATSGKHSTSYLFIQKMYQDISDDYGRFYAQYHPKLEDLQMKHLSFFIRIRELDRQARAARGQLMEEDDIEEGDYAAYDEYCSMSTSDWYYDYDEDISNAYIDPSEP